MQINPEKFQNYRSDYHNLATSDDDNVPIVLATIQYQTEEGDNSTWKEDNKRGPLMQLKMVLSVYSELRATIMVKMRFNTGVYCVNN